MHMANPAPECKRVARKAALPDRGRAAASARSAEAERSPRRAQPRLSGYPGALSRG